MWTDKQKSDLSNKSKLSTKACSVNVAIVLKLCYHDWISSQTLKTSRHLWNRLNRIQVTDILLLRPILLVIFLIFIHISCIRRVALQIDAVLITLQNLNISNLHSDKLFKACWPLRSRNELIITDHYNSNASIKSLFFALLSPFELQILFIPHAGMKWIGQTQQSRSSTQYLTECI